MAQYNIILQVYYELVSHVFFSKTISLLKKIYFKNYWRGK